MYFIFFLLQVNYPNNVHCKCNFILLFDWLLNFNNIYIFFYLKSRILIIISNTMLFVVGTGAGRSGQGDSLRSPKSILTEDCTRILTASTRDIEFGYEPYLFVLSQIRLISLISFLVYHKCQKSTRFSQNYLKELVFFF